MFRMTTLQTIFFILVKENLSGLYVYLENSQCQSSVEYVPTHSMLTRRITVMGVWCY